MRFLIVIAIVCAAARAHADRAHARALVDEGTLRAQAGDRDGALARYEKAMDDDPDLLDAYDAAIPLWLDGKRWTEATTYLERATVRHGDYAAGWYALGFVYRQQQRWDRAVAAYEESTGLQPGDAAPWYGLAASYEGAARRGDAVRAYRAYRARERDPARAKFRADARAAISRLLGPPADWRDAVLRLALDGGDRAAFAAAAKLARP
jgi:tetratricopeptide (TPR) repeat protein